MTSKVEVPTQECHPAQKEIFKTVNQKILDITLSTITFNKNIMTRLLPEEKKHMHCRQRYNDYRFKQSPNP